MKALYEFLINNKSTGLISDPDFVDLGLSVLWCKYNIGARKETDTGHYYQWGGLEPMDDKECTWETAPFNDGFFSQNETYFEKHINEIYPDDNLSNTYDIAYQTYKDNKVHIPTLKQIEELFNGTDIEFKYKGDGIKFINKKNINNYIFIHTSGTKNEKTINCLNAEVNFWSSTLYNTGWYNFAYAAACHNTKPLKTYYYICLGMPVRPVKDK